LLYIFNIKAIIKPLTKPAAVHTKIFAALTTINDIGSMFLRQWNQMGIQLQSFDRVLLRGEKLNSSLKANSSRLPNSD
jgi:hypothetical protein